MLAASSGREHQPARPGSRFAAFRAPLIVALAAVLVATLGDAGALALRYEREAIHAGAFWRLLTGHWVHLGWQHLALNLAALFLIWHLFGAALNTRSWLLLILALAVGQSLALLAFHPDIAWYLGLSGLLHGMLAAGALLSLRASPLLAGVALVLLLGKLALEAWQGPTAGMADWLGGAVITEAHLYGAACGLAGAAAIALLRRSRALCQPHP